MTEYSSPHYIRQALTAPDFDVRGWVNDLFSSFEDENGEIHISVGPELTTTHISTELITTDRIYI